MSICLPMRRASVALGACWLAATLASGRALPAEPPLTLDAAVELAVRHAPALVADAVRIDAARQDAMRAGRLPDPELTLGVENLPVQGPGAYTFGADEMTMRTLGVMQRIPSRASRDAERSLAEAGIIAANAARVAAGGDVRRSAATAWIARWAAERRRALLGELLDETGTAVRAARARLAGGTGSASEALAARGELAALESRIDAADAADAAAQADLARWLDAAATRTLADPPDFATLPVPPAQLLARIDAQAALLPLSARERQADAAIAAAKAGKRPEWRVGVRYGSRVAGLPDMTSVEVGFSLPLFARNRQDRAISARYAERTAAVAELDDARRAQRATVGRELAEWQGASRQVQRYRDELLPLAHDRTQAALAAYGGGAPLQAWLDARRDEVTVRIAYADALDGWGRSWAALAYLLPTTEDSP